MPCCRAADRVSSLDNLRGYVPRAPEYGHDNGAEERLLLVRSSGWLAAGSAFDSDGRLARQGGVNCQRHRKSNAMKFPPFWTRAVTPEVTCDRYLAGTLGETMTTS
jgi:hypothetical protein